MQAQKNLDRERGRYYIRFVEKVFRDHVREMIGLSPGCAECFQEDRDGSATGSG